MITVKVKICGITNHEDAQAAIEMGADILGFNFYPPSPRYVEPSKAEEIIHKVPAFVDIAGVFVNAQPQDIRKLTDPGLLNWVQFHGDETPEFCAPFNAWNLHTIKAVRVQTADDIEKATHYRTFALLLDAFDPSLYGGTGKTFDWSLVGPQPERIFLAGGLSPANIEKALSVDVYGVDICSGIESEPGKKDHLKMKQLFEAIYQYTNIKVSK